MQISKKTKKILLTLVVIGAIAGSWAVWYVFFKPHRDVGSEKPAYTMSAEALSTAFSSSDDAMNTYIDKAILIDGTVTAVEGSNISLGNIICNFEGDALDALKKVAVGQDIQVQGRLSTYNDLLDEIVIDKCVVK